MATYTSFLLCALSAAFLAVFLAIPSTAAVPVPSSSSNDSHVIEVYNNYTYVPGIPFNRTGCKEDINECPNLFQYTSYGTSPMCKNKIVCCPLDNFKNTIPQYVPVITRPDVSDLALTDYGTCHCKPVSYTLLYLERDETNHNWLARKTDVHVGYRCDFEKPLCKKFMC